MGAEEPMNDLEAPARLSGVTKRYQTISALHDVSLTVRAGETLALLGPNGAGKTTAIRTLLGMIRPDAGTATLFGRDPHSAPNRARVGAMLQVSGVPATLTVAEHVGLFATYYPRPLPIAETLAIAGLRGLEKRLYGELSGGQKQRVAFALAICGDPDLLILDEPTSALDVESRLALWAQIRGYVARGRSVLLATHDLGEAEALAGRIAVLLAGRIVAEGSPAEIKARAGGTIVRCSTALTLERVRALPDVDEVLRSAGAVRITTRDADALVRRLYVEDPSFTLIEVAARPLEDAFLALTQHAPTLHSQLTEGSV
jgi:ABC-2 type transport system ATP-binding protein